MREQINRFTANFFARPSWILLAFMGAFIILWTVQCSLLQNIQGLDALETVTWGAQWEWGHFKHPPLSGWIGYGFSAMAGHADWGLYLGTQLCIAVGVWFAYKLAREFWKDDCTAATAALLLYALHYYNPSWMKFSTYFIEIALRPIMAYYFFIALRDNRFYQWSLFGFFCGLGILCKYSTGLLLVAFLILFLLRKDLRKQFFSYGPYLAFGVFLLVIAPHINWLFQNDFACFRHVEDRMDDPHTWLVPFETLANIIYPFAAQAVVLCLACIPRFRNRLRKPRNKEALRWSLVLTLTPCVFLLLLSLLGSDIIPMWFCSLACWTGIAVVALFPFAITPELFRRLCCLMIAYTAILFIGTSIDLLTSSRSRLHTKPEAIVQPVQAFWQAHSNTPIPVVAGECWLAAVIENYTPNRPPACFIEDKLAFNLYKEKIARTGALLIGKEPGELTKFAEQADVTGIRFTPVAVSYKAVFGKTRTLKFFVGYLPPFPKK